MAAKLNNTPPSDQRNPGPVRRIALVEPRTHIPNIYSSLVSPRLGLPAMAGGLKRLGYVVDVYCEGVRKFSIHELAQYDLVGISILTNTAPRGYQYAAALKTTATRVVLGGPHASCLPDEALRYCDYVVRGEGETTLPELLRALAGNQPLAAVAGLSYHDGAHICHNPAPPFSCDHLNEPSDLTAVRHLKSFAGGWLNRYRFIPSISTSRGCPHACRYCTVGSIAGHQPRFRDIAVCLAEIQQAAALTRKDIFIADDNFAMNIPRTKDFLRQLIRLGLPRHLTFLAQIRMEALRDEELLSLLQTANFELLHVGYESISPHTLADLHKRQSIADMADSITRARRYGLKINGMFLAGSDHDTEETLRATVDFAIESDMATLQFFILTPLPGSEIYQQLEQEHRIFNHDWSHYDCHHSVFFPKQIQPSTLQRCIREGNNCFYSFKRMLDRAPGNRVSYGINVHRMNGWMRRYERGLRRIEQDYYDSSEQLILDRFGTA